MTELEEKETMLINVQNPLTIAKSRLPWLIILLFLGLMTASLIGQFEETLSQKAILAVASGPFISTINDLISIFIYFGLATTFMRYLL